MISKYNICASLLWPWLAVLVLDCKYHTCIKTSFDSEIMLAC
jgi:hypothetical protein